MDERDGVESEVGHVLPRVAFIPLREAPNRWSFGETLYVSSPDADGTQLVAVLISDVADSELLRVAPISTETLNATDEDLLLEAWDSPLGYAAMVSVWNFGFVLKEQVANRGGLLEADALQELASLVAWVDAPHEDDGVALHTRASDVTSNRRGVPILSDSDPRAVFQDLENQRAKPFWLPSARAISEEQLTDIGVLLEAWMAAEGLDDVEYGERIGVSPRLVSSVRGGKFSEDAVSPALLAEIFAPTAVPVERAVTALSDFLARPRIARSPHGSPRRRSGIVYEMPQSRVAGPPETLARRQLDEISGDYVTRFRVALMRMREHALPE